MGRAPCCEKDSVKRGPWTPEEDAKLLACIAQHGTGSWRTLPKKAGLQRCGKSCRLRWTNYLRPDLKHGRFTDHEEQLIVKLHAALGSRWSLIAAQLPGRTDNDVKNYWNTRLKKKLCEMGIDPITHKPISQLLADLAGSIAIPKGGQIAEAALGCFKDDMLNVLMRKRPDWQLEGSLPPSSSNAMLRSAPPATVRNSWQAGPSSAPLSHSSKPMYVGKEDSAADPFVMQKIKQGLTTAVQSKLPLPTTSAVPDDSMMKDVAPDILLMRGFSANPFSPGNEMPASCCYFDSSSSKTPPGFGAFKSWNNSEDNATGVISPSTALGLHVGMSPSLVSQQDQQQQVYSNFFQQQQTHHQQQQQQLQMVKESSPSGIQRESGEAQVPWSPSGSGSSCSSTTLADVSVLEGVLSSDVPLWDFSELSSIIS